MLFMKTIPNFSDSKQHLSININLLVPELKICAGLANVSLKVLIKEAKPVGFVQRLIYFKELAYIIVRAI